MCENGNTFLTLEKNLTNAQHKIIPILPTMATEECDDHVKFCTCQCYVPLQMTRKKNNFWIYDFFRYFYFLLWDKIMTFWWLLWPFSENDEFFMTCMICKTLSFTLYLDSYEFNCCEILVYCQVWYFKQTFQKWNSSGHFWQMITFILHFLWWLAHYYSRVGSRALHNFYEESSIKKK